MSNERVLMINQFKMHWLGIRWSWKEKWNTRYAKRDQNFGSVDLRVICMREIIVEKNRQKIHEK